MNVSSCGCAKIKKTAETMKDRQFFVCFSTEEILFVIVQELLGFSPQASGAGIVRCRHQSFDNRI